jgi:hypothetical protein
MFIARTLDGALSAMLGVHGTCVHLSFSQFHFGTALTWQTCTHCPMCQAHLAWFLNLRAPCMVRARRGSCCEIAKRASGRPGGSEGEPPATQQPDVVRELTHDNEVLRAQVSALVPQKGALSRVMLSQYCFPCAADIQRQFQALEEALHDTLS